VGWIDIMSPCNCIGIGIENVLIAPSCNNNGIKYKKPVIDVQHKTIHKRSRQKKEKK
jgi:hypothetical protein